MSQIRKMLDHDRLLAALTPADVAAHLPGPRYRRGTVIRTACPRCGPPKPRLHVYATSQGPRAKCHVCGYFASPANLIRDALGLPNATEALKLLVPHAPLDTRDLPPIPPPEPPRYPDLSALPLIPLTAEDVEIFSRRGLVPPPRARSLHPTATLPEWAAHLRPHYTCTLPVYAPHTPTPTSTRHWRRTPHPTAPKRLPPKGYSTRDLTLRTHPDPHTPHRVTLLTEGEPDYCRAAMWAAAWCRTRTIPVPVIGWLSGSRLPAYLTAAAPPAEPPTRPATASATVQAPYPSAAHAPAATPPPSATAAPLTVLVATHPDQAGDRYADTIRDQAGPHVTVIRTRPPRDLDECTVGELDELFGRWM